MDFLPDMLQDYIEKHTTSESALLHQINRATHLNVLKPRMLSGHLQGRVLSMISHMIQPKRVLEIGTYTGYSALCLAEGLDPSGILYTLEQNEELEETIRSAFIQCDKNIQLLIGDAVLTIPTLKETWDLVFIDADKGNYATYFELTLPQLRSGGFMIIDNVLWSGKVADASISDKTTQTIRQFNQMVQEHQSVENVLFPIRDGLMILRKL